MASRWAFVAALAGMALLPCAPGRAADGVPAAAAPPGPATASAESYRAIRSDGDRYCGEGVAAPADFGGDVDKALESARDAARQDLVAKVRGGETAPVPDAAWSRVQIAEFEGIPDRDHITVLASLGKGRIRGGSAGNAPENGVPDHALSVSLAYWAPSSLASAPASAGAGGGSGGQPVSPLNDTLGPGTGAAQTASSSSSPQPAPVFGVGYAWGPWAAQLGVADVGPVQFQDYQASRAAGATQLQQADLEVIRLSLGYDWAPWRLQLQPFVPLRLEYSFWDLSPYAAQTAGAGIGLGLRYWLSSSFALQFVADWHQGLLDGTLTRSGSAFQAGPGRSLSVGGSGPEASLSLLFSAF